MFVPPCIIMDLPGTSQPGRQTVQPEGCWGAGGSGGSARHTLDADIMRRAEMMILVIIFISQTPYGPTFNALRPILTKVICNGRGIVNKYEPFCVDNG